MELIDGFVDGLHRGGGVLILTGEAGVGKTVLLDLAAKGAAAHGVQVLRGAGVEFEAEISFLSLNQVLLPLRGQFDDLPARHRDALLVALGLGEGPAPDRLRICNAALALLDEAARRLPILLIVDDLPWLDRASAGALSFVARALGQSRVGFLGAASRKHARPRVSAAVSHGIGLTISCLITYELVMRGLADIHSLSAADDLLGGMWAVIATVYVYRESQRQSREAAGGRAAATLLSFVLCLIYLLVFSFHPLGLALVIGIGTIVLMMIGREQDVVTTGITTAVVLVAAGLSPHDAWQQPILRLVDTAVGLAVGLAASSIATRVAQRVSPANRGFDGRLVMVGEEVNRPHPEHDVEPRFGFRSRRRSAKQVETGAPRVLGCS